MVKETVKEIQSAKLDAYIQERWWRGFYVGWISGISYYSILYWWFQIKK
jgi:hypothetical protein